MKHLRFLIIGIVLGGAFGAKIGAYVSRVSETSISFELIEFGFALGAGLGLLISLIFQVMTSDVLERKNEPSATSMMTYTS